jgi:hypothetical protein
MTARTLSDWLAGVASGDALLAAWHEASRDPLANYELMALAAAARAGRTRTAITIAVPSGRSRLPLLAAVHAAALRLPGFPSPFSGGGAGPVALVTTQIARRAELTDLDAAGVPVSPGLHPARLRSDRLLAPLHARKPAVQGQEHRLLLVGLSARWVVPDMPPAAVVIDATDEPWQFATDATAWAAACGAVPIVFADIANHARLDDGVAFPCGWSQILATSPDESSAMTALAAVRGHAVVMTAGPLEGLPSSAALLGAARRHGPLPPMLVEASVLWRRLDELVVPMGTYDAACPRWHTPTLSERLEDLLEVRAEEFPPGWRAWAQTGWAGIKDGIAAAAAALRTSNPKSALLTEAVDADLRAGLVVDVAMPSRTARDALTWHLADAGVPIPADGSLIVRSLGDVGPWKPPRATLLAAPPARRLRQRMTAADVGPLSVLCYDHEIAPLRRILCDALDEPDTVGGPVGNLLPRALRLEPVIPAQRPAVMLTVTPREHGTHRRDAMILPHLADAVEIAGLAALKEPAQEADSDLPDENGSSPASSGNRPCHQSLVEAVPLTVVSLAGGQPTVVHLPADGKAARVLDGTVRRIPVREVLPGMLLAGLDSLTPFDRLRPLLPEARGPITRMLLAAWDQAIENALRRHGGPVRLATALRREGARISTPAVAAWVDEDRIGPRDDANVARVGGLAGHPVVAGHGHAIAAAMQHLRRLHQAIGRIVASPATFDAGAATEIEQLLGPDALSILEETVIYRITAVGTVTTVSGRALYRTSPALGEAGETMQQEAGDDRLRGRGRSAPPVPGGAKQRPASGGRASHCHCA